MNGKDEYTQKLELALGRLLYASRLVMDIVAEEGIGSDEETSETAVTEMQTARRNAQAVLDGTFSTSAASKADQALPVQHSRGRSKLFKD